MPTSRDQPVAVLRIGQTLYLYPDRIEWWHGFRRRRAPLNGLTAAVQSVGKTLTLRNQAFLVIRGGDLVLTRGVKGSRRVKDAARFAAQLNALSEV